MFFCLLVTTRFERSNSIPMRMYTNSSHSDRSFKKSVCPSTVGTVALQQISKLVTSSRRGKAAHVTHFEVAEERLHFVQFQAKSGKYRKSHREKEREGEEKENESRRNSSRGPKKCRRNGRTCDRKAGNPGCYRRRGTSRL